MIGLAAPAIFGLNRLLGPRAVAAMLERFSPITLLCGVVLIACWFVECRANARTSSTRSRGLRVQGVCLTAMLLVGGYLALVAEPRIRSLQPPLRQTILQTEKVVGRNGSASINPTKVVVESGQFASPQARAEFRKLHGLYGGLTTIVVLLGVVVLAISAARSVSEKANVKSS